MKKHITFPLIALLLFSFSACKKDNPVAEADQEEISAVEISFTEVESDNPTTHTLSYKGNSMLPTQTEPIQLNVGKSYRFSIKIKDFEGRETQQSFVEKDDQHFAFLLGLSETNASVSYSDVKNDGTKVMVGIQGYLTILKETVTFTARYIMRHLNPGVKARINPTVDWNNINFNSFTGANDLDLKLNLQFTTLAKAE